MLIPDKGCSIRVVFLIHTQQILSKRTTIIIKVKSTETFFVFFVSNPKKVATFAPWMKRK